MVRVSKFVNRKFQQNILNGDDPTSIFNDKDLNLNTLSQPGDGSVGSTYALACVLQIQGNNLFLCEFYDTHSRQPDTGDCIIPKSKGHNVQMDANGSNSTGLVELPPKFRNLIWIKRGTYIVVELWQQSNIKILGAVAHILRPEQIRSLQKRGILRTDCESGQDTEEASDNIWPSTESDEYE